MIHSVELCLYFVIEEEQIYKRLKPLDKIIMNHIKTGTTMELEKMTRRWLKIDAYQMRNIDLGRQKIYYR